MNGRLVGTGATLCLLAVALGAFGTHSLRGRLSPDLLGVWRTGVEYHFGHGLATILAGIGGSDRLIRSAGWLFLAGVILFSGSLYALALTDVPRLGAITPLGGLCFLAGWTLFAIGSFRGK